MTNSLRIFFTLLFLAAARGYSESPHYIGYELYSWQKDGSWHFSIFEGTTTARSKSTIQAANNRLKAISYLKGRIAEIPSKETLYWREDKTRGLQLPPREMIIEIYKFTKSCNLKLLLPGETANSDAYKEMKSDIDQLLD